MVQRRATDPEWDFNKDWGPVHVGGGVGTDGGKFGIGFGGSSSSLVQGGNGAEESKARSTDPEWDFNKDWGPVHVGGGVGTDGGKFGIGFGGSSSSLAQGGNAAEESKARSTDPE